MQQQAHVWLLGAISAQSMQYGGIFVARALRSGETAARLPPFAPACGTPRSHTPGLSHIHPQMLHVSCKHQEAPSVISVHCALRMTASSWRRVDTMPESQQHTEALREHLPQSTKCLLQTHESTRPVFQITL